MCGLKMADFYMLVRFLEFVHDWRSLTFSSIKRACNLPIEILCNFLNFNCYIEIYAQYYSAI